MYGVDLMIRSSEQGFSTIEIIISVFLIGLIVVAVMLFSGTSLKTSTANRLKNNAVRLAQQTIENLKQYDQQGFNRNTFRTIPGVIGNQIPSPVVDGVTYNVNTQIIPDNLNPDIANNNNYIPIRITVSWNYLGRNQITVDTCMIQWQ